jgi:hypothetical protein
MHRWFSKIFISLQKSRCLGREVGSRATVHVAHGDVGALPIREVGFGATRHEATSKPSLAGRQVPELLDMWQCRSPPYQGGMI